MSDERLALMSTSGPCDSALYPAMHPAPYSVVPADHSGLSMAGDGFTQRSFPAMTLASTDGCSAIAQLALLGAVIGGSAAAGANIRRLQREEVDTADALADTARAALATAAASAVAGAAAGAVRQQGLPRLGVLFASGTAVMYGIQRYLERGTDS